MTNTSTQTHPSDIHSEPSNKDKKFEHIKTTHEHLMTLQKALDEALDAFAKEKSLFSKLATYWSKTPLWIRIGAGFALIVPLLVISLFTQLAVLLTISFFVSFIYIASSILLSNHHQQSSVHIEKFKEIVKNLTILQVSLIELINELHEQLKQEINQLASENITLTDNVSQLNQEIINLSSSIEQLMQIKQQLKKTVTGLEETAEQLKSATGEQSELFVTTNAQLEMVRKEYENNQTQLSEHIRQIEHLKSKMEADRLKAQNTIQALNKTVSTLSSMLTLNGEQRILFNKKLTEFLANKEQQFDQIAEALSQTTTKLATTTEHIKGSSHVFVDLIQIQSQLINQLEEMVIFPEEPVKDEPSIPGLSTKALKTLGVFAENPPTSSAQDFDEKLAPKTQINVL
jgi:DNA repair exonuclease SbcCD ATPase subunit